jgi:hypothetical protein
MTHNSFCPNVRVVCIPEARVDGNGMPKSHRELVSHKLSDIILPDFSCRLSSSFSRDLCRGRFLHAGRYRREPSFSSLHQNPAEQVANPGSSDFHGHAQPGSDIARINRIELAVQIGWQFSFRKPASCARAASNYGRLGQSAQLGMRRLPELPNLLAERLPVRP